MLKTRYILREIRDSGWQGVLFVLCVALGLITLVAVWGFSDSVNASLRQDARQLQAADAVASSHYEFPPNAQAAIARFTALPDIETTRIWEFYSLVRNTATDYAVLSQVKIVEHGYPFYGEVILASGRQFREVLQPGTVIVADGLLQRIGARVGDRIALGEATLTIADVVLEEPDQPMSFFTLGPRIFVGAADLEQLALVGRQSRIQYYYLFKTAQPALAESLAAELEALSVDDRIDVKTALNSDSRLQRFFDNLLFFLHLIGVFSLILAGLGIKSTITAYLRDRLKSIAIMKVLGATNHSITVSYLLVALGLGLVGIGLGIAGGFMLELTLPAALEGFIPIGVEFTLSPIAVAQALLIGCGFIVIFTLIPLTRLREVKPTSILQHNDSEKGGGVYYYLANAAALVLVASLIFWQMAERRYGSWFVGGFAGVIILSGALTHACLWWVRKLRFRILALRLARKGLFRPGNATHATIITLAAAFGVILSLFLVEENLKATFVTSFPEDTPNLYFIDIQPEQTGPFATAVGHELIFFPVVRGRVTAINGDASVRDEDRSHRHGNLRREMNLTYRAELLDNEVLLAGKTLFRDDWQGPQVSILEEVVDRADVGVGDIISFRIHGVPLAARVASIRGRTEKSLKPYFFFVFPPATLQAAPQTLFSALKLEADAVPELRNRLAAKFPGITAIDVSGTITAFAKVLEKLTTIIRNFTLISAAAGVLIIISSIFATRHARIREVAYFKVLGAPRAFIFRCYLWEHLLLGIISALLAFGLAHTASWLICTQILDIGYHTFLARSAGIAAAVPLLIIIIGITASRNVLKQRPINFLRKADQR